jgi:hypothetical protein
VPAISVSPDLLNYAYQSGGNLPQAQLIGVTGGGAAATFMVSTSSSGSLSVSPAFPDGDEHLRQVDFELRGR